KRNNHTLTTEVTFQGFSSSREHELTLFVLFFVLYTLNLADDVIIITLPIIFSVTSTPSFPPSARRPLQRPWTPWLPRGHELVHLTGGLYHTDFLVNFGVTNYFPLTAMGYDCYVAIGNPLNYTLIMSKSVCAQLVGGACSTGLLVARTQVTSVLRFPFCAANIGHFFCNIRPVMKLSCSDPIANEILTLGLLFISYVLTISTILKIASAEGRAEEGLCHLHPHLSVVIIHYGCASIIYLKPQSENSRDQDQLISGSYTVSTPCWTPHTPCGTRRSRTPCSGLWAGSFPVNLESAHLRLFTFTQALKVNEELELEQKEVEEGQGEEMDTGERQGMMGKDEKKLSLQTDL
ncbi:LOW QUALITY PROTEIN: Olfactory receptor 10J1, partial [Galemys pyrenaicus]